MSRREGGGPLGTLKEQTQRERVSHVRLSILLVVMWLEDASSRQVSVYFYVHKTLSSKVNLQIPLMLERQKKKERAIVHLDDTPLPKVCPNLLVAGGRWPQPKEFPREPFSPLNKMEMALD